MKLIKWGKNEDKGRYGTKRITYSLQILFLTINVTIGNIMGPMFNIYLIIAKRYQIMFNLTKFDKPLNMDHIYGDA